MTDVLLFVPACFALNLAFGPNNLLAMTHGARNGVGFAFGASMARLAVFVPMIAASALGLGLVMATSAIVFNAVKIVGAIYLIWIGVKLLRTAPAVGAVAAGQVSSFPKALRSEALVAVSNPKAILIFAAFFPQFVDMSNYWLSYLVLGAVFLALEAVAIVIYASAGRFAAGVAADRLHWFQRASGGGMILFGLLLLFSRQPGRVAV
ncbi:LysE family translocator [Pseudoruegeria sp. HB172150]|uniref:LysE family translocator n=1 Tax=Pseudoruegeria sp. HB172150 TaxID=2721164 RepID=UPI001551D6FB|nr:LysE family translocator [Pseudoruegeria sp. HB172150]